MKLLFHSVDCHRNKKVHNWLYRELKISYKRSPLPKVCLTALDPSSHPSSTRRQQVSIPSAQGCLKTGAIPCADVGGLSQGFSVGGGWGKCLPVEGELSRDLVSLLSAEALEPLACDCFPSPRLYFIQPSGLLFVLLTHSLIYSFTKGVPIPCRADARSWDANTNKHCLGVALWLSAILKCANTHMYSAFTHAVPNSLCMITQWIVTVTLSTNSIIIFIWRKSSWRLERRRSLPYVASF